MTSTPNILRPLLALTLALPLALSATGCGETKTASAGGAAGQSPKHAPPTTGRRVEVATVAATSATLRLVRPGEVEPAKESRVASAMGGYVESISVEVGDIVKKGALLAKVDSSLHGANKALVEVELDDAERELKRLESLGKSIPTSRVDAAKTRVLRAKAQLRVSRIQSARTVVKAPFAGTVADVGTEKGEVLAPGMLVARIVQMNPAVISVSTADRDVGSLQVGGEASVTAAGMPGSAKGTIRRIEPTANTKTRSFTVEVEVPNDEGRLRPGMIASVDFRRTVSQDTIVLPQYFLVTRLDDNGVFVVGADDVARWRPLKLGQVVRDQVVVEGGLKPGERVVVLGQRSLADGDALIVAREGKCCTEGRVIFSGPGDGPQVAAAAAKPTAPAEAPSAPAPEGKEAGK